MNKRDLALVRKLFAKKTNCISRIAGYYVNPDGKIESEIDESWYSMPEEDIDLHLALMRKGISGRMGRNLFVVPFSLEEETTQNGRQVKLYELLKSELKNSELNRAYCEGIAGSFHFEGQYIILMAYGAYDVPAKSSDGANLEDASDSVYAFVQISILPLVIGKKVLTLGGNIMMAAANGYVVDSPVVSVLFPGYEEGSDIHEVLYYVKKEDERYLELFDQITGSDFPTTESAQKSLFSDIVEQTLGTECSFDVVRNLNAAVERKIEEDSVSEEPSEIGKKDLERLLLESGAPDETVEVLDKTYDQIVGEAASFSTQSLNAGKVYRLESPLLKATVSAEKMEFLQTRMIDGREMLLIPTNGMTINGVRLSGRHDDEDAEDEYGDDE